jgi:hypothetical protein
MLRQDVKVGKEYSFGRQDWDQTPCIVLKLNSVRCKVQIKQNRGSYPAGSIFNVDYSMLRTIGSKDADIVAKKEPMEYNPFMPHADKLIMEAILSVYGELSPENLTCDGEASRQHVRAKSIELNRKLKYLIAAIGQDVSESDAYSWYESQRKYEKEHEIVR